MQYTLKQAEKALTQYSNAYGVTNVRDAINKSVASLAQMANWQCLRKVLRFFSAGPCFTLPQGYAGLVRAFVNGRPTPLRGQDFSFVQSGPGDLKNPPVGFDPIDIGDIRDIGTDPTYVVPPIGRLFAFTDAEDYSSEPYLFVQGISPDGKSVSTRLAMQPAPVYDPATGKLISGIEMNGDVAIDDVEFAVINSVVLGDDATGYVTLCIQDSNTTRRSVVATYHPDIKVPSFRHYRIVGIPDGAPTEVLAEVRLDPLPLIRDTDILPIDSLEPIEWMIMADWKLKSSEVDAANKYITLAANWMKSKETADATVQTAVVINNRLAGSMFEVSDAAWNI